MGKYPATRDSLIKLKNLKRSVEKGYNLLKKKQDSLVLEVLSELRKILKDREELESKIRESYDLLIEAIKREGFVYVYSIALSYSSGVKFEEIKKNIAGVKFTDYSYKLEDFLKKEKSPVELDPLLINVQKNFKEIFIRILDIARKYHKVKLLLEELKKVRKRINSLEKIVLPSIEEEINYIKQRLDDMERDEKARLKFIAKL